LQLITYICIKTYIYDLRRTLHNDQKKEKMSQSDMGKLLDIDGDAYGRYERNEVKPSVEMATKIANALGVSLDYLVGKTDLELDAGTIRRIEEVSKMSDEDKKHMYAFLDAFITKTRLQGFAL